MIKAHAEARYQQLLIAAGIDALARKVIELHSPGGGTLSGQASCSGCPGSIQGDMPEWPEDCLTTLLVAELLHVDLRGGRS